MKKFFYKTSLLSGLNFSIIKGMDNLNNIFQDNLNNLNPNINIVQNNNTVQNNLNNINQNNNIAQNNYEHYMDYYLRDSNGNYPEMFGYPDENNDFIYSHCIPLIEDDEDENIVDEKNKNKNAIGSLTPKFETEYVIESIYRIYEKIDYLNRENIQYQIKISSLLNINIHYLYNFFKYIDNMKNIESIYFFREYLFTKQVIFNDKGIKYIIEGLSGLQTDCEELLEKRKKFKDLSEAHKKRYGILNEEQKENLNYYIDYIKIMKNLLRNTFNTCEKNNNIFLISKKRKRNKKNKEDKENLLDKEVEKNKEDKENLLDKKINGNQDFFNLFSNFKLSDIEKCLSFLNFDNINIESVNFPYISGLILYIYQIRNIQIRDILIKYFPLDDHNKELIINIFLKHNLDINMLYFIPNIEKTFIYFKFVEFKREIKDIYKNFVKTTYQNKEDFEKISKEEKEKYVGFYRTMDYFINSSNNFKVKAFKIGIKGIEEDYKLLLNRCYNNAYKSRIENVYNNVILRNNPKVDPLKFVNCFLNFNNKYIESETPINLCDEINIDSFYDFIEKEYDYYYEKDGNLKK